MPSVRISEMYDMSTVQGKIGVIGVHTPDFASIDRKWHGYFLNHRFFKIRACTVKIACASNLPLDALGVGTSPGKVAPQDIMNPILYRAVSNETWNAFVGRIYSFSNSTGSIDKNSVHAEPDAFPSFAGNQENLYYALLSSDEWRKAMPQQGLVMSGLKPLCYPVVSQFGSGENGSVSASSGVNAPVWGTDGTGNPASSNTTANSAVYFRGEACPMPRLPCTPRGINVNDAEPPDLYSLTASPSIPRTYVACIVVPPMVLNRMFYRMIISWDIDFYEPVSLAEKRTASDNAIFVGQDSYLRTYQFADNSKALPEDESKSTGFSDSIGFEPNLVMEK